MSLINKKSSNQSAEYVTKEDNCYTDANNHIKLFSSSIFCLSNVSKMGDNQTHADTILLIQK